MSIGSGPHIVDRDAPAPGLSGQPRVNIFIAPSLPSRARDQRSDTLTHGYTDVE